LNVLVVEDTPANQKLISKILQRRGHLVTLANNGKEALEHCATTPYDIVLMDVQMPTMDGFQATTAIRNSNAERPATSPQVPIIAMTAHAMKGDRERCLAVGMNGYISKPIVARHVIETIETACHGSRAGPKPTDTNLPNNGDSMNNEPRVDLAAALMRMNNDEQLLNDMMQLYLEDSSSLLEQVRRAVRDNDLSSLERSAHSLKGLAANFEALAAVAAANDVELAARKQETDGLEKRISLLESETVLLANFLRKRVDERSSSS
jgi:CheY-like chemotaxis protein